MYKYAWKHKRLQYTDLINWYSLGIIIYVMRLIIING